MTDKATVEIPSPVDGKVVVARRRGRRRGRGRLAADPPEGGRARTASLPTGAARRRPSRPPGRATSRLRRTRAAKTLGSHRRAAATSAPPSRRPRCRRALAVRLHRPPVARAEGEKPLASPAVRLRAREAGIDLRQVRGTGPAGRITHEDLDAFFAATARQVADGAGPAPEHARRGRQGRRAAPQDRREDGAREVAHPAFHLCRGSRRHRARGPARRAQREQASRPAEADAAAVPDARAWCKAIAEQPQLNARYDDEAGDRAPHGGVHIGIATQTAVGPDGAGGAACRGARPLGLRRRARTGWPKRREAGIGDAARS